MAGSLSAGVYSWLEVNDDQEEEEDIPYEEVYTAHGEEVYSHTPSYDLKVANNQNEEVYSSLEDHHEHVLVAVEDNLCAEVYNVHAQEGVGDSQKILEVYSHTPSYNLKGASNQNVGVYSWLEDHGDHALVVGEGILCEEVCSWAWAEDSLHEEAYIQHEEAGIHLGAHTQVLDYGCQYGAG